MGILDFLQKTVTISRLETVSGNRRAYAEVGELQAAIQERQSDPALELDQVQSRQWTAYFAIDADVEEGDLVTDSYGTMYKVDAITRKDYGINQHLDVILVAYDDV